MHAKQAPENRGFVDFSVELIGIEPTASRVRWHGDGPAPKDFAGLDRQEAPGNVPERPILATRSQNAAAADRVTELLNQAGRAWNEGSDRCGLRELLLTIMALLDG